MKFQRMEAENFLSIGKVELDLENRGLVVITGENHDDSSTQSNGAGKSSVIEAIHWCLYGDTLRGIKYADSVVNTVTGSDCRVLVEVSVSNGKVVIERYRKHKKHKNSIFVHVNGEPLHSTDPRTTQKVINSLLGMEKDVFGRLVLIGQGFNSRFSDMSDRELKEFLESRTGSFIYAKAHERVSREAVELEGRTKALMDAASALEIHILDLQRQIAEEAENSARREQERDAAISGHRASLASLQQAIVEKENRIKQYDDLIKTQEINSKITVDGIKSSIASLNASLVVENEALNSIWAENDKNLKEALAQLDAQSAHYFQALAAEYDAAKSKMAGLAHKRDTEWHQFLLNQKSLTETHQRSLAELEAKAVQARGALIAFKPTPVPQTLINQLSLQEANLSTLDAQIAQAQSESGTTCPRCGQVVTSATVQRRISEITSDNTARDSLVQTIAELKRLITEAEFRVTQEEQVKQSLIRAESDVREEIRKEQSRQSVEIASLTEEAQKNYGLYEPLISEAQKELDAISLKHQEASRGVDEERRRITQEFRSALANKESTHRESIRRIDLQIQEANSKISTEYEILKSAVSGIQNDIRQVTTSINQDRDSMRGVEVKIAQLSAQDLYAALNALKASFAQAESQRESNELQVKEAGNKKYVLEYLSTAFGPSGIRSYMLDSTITFLNERLREYCRFLFDGRVLIELSPQAEQKNKKIVEKISLSVSTRGGSYDTASGGERRKVDVGLFLAFRDLSRLTSPVSTNLEAYDEVLSFLDGESASRVVQLLVNESSVGTRLLITHRSDVPIIGPHTILKAVKRQGVTQYVTG
jgi:DNA repair exonuclease SbcCD ATPase subunit